MKSRRFFWKFVMVVGVLWLLLTRTAEAYESFTVNLSFYQGIDLTTGMKAFDPRVLTLILNPSDHVDLVLGPNTGENLFTFSDEVDFFIEYDPNAESPITLKPENLLGVVVLDGLAFDAVTAEMLAGFDFDTGLTPVHLDSNDLVALWLEDGTYMLLGSVRQLPDWTLLFEYRPIATAIPEPSTLLLLGTGCLFLLYIKRRTYIPFQKEEHR